MSNAGAADFKANVGKRSSARTFRVTEERLKQFCEAIGGEYRGEAPPTFLTILRDGEFELFDTMEIPLKSVLHGDQEYRYERPILPGDEIRYETVVSKAFEKQGTTGSLKFLAFETEYQAQRGGVTAPVGFAKSTVIIRS